MALEISRTESTEFSYPLENVGTDGHGFNPVYDPGETMERKLFGLEVHTAQGITGEYVGGSSPGFARVKTFADYLVGKNPLHRERHWSEIKRALRKYDRTGIGPVDIALRDIAGEYHGAPVHELLGTYRTELPACASTYFGDTTGGLDSPEALADFAETCRDLGYPGYKIQGWGGSDADRDVDREIATAREVGERVGHEMDPMLDPACEYETYADALEVGRVYE